MFKKKKKTHHKPEEFFLCENSQPPFFSQMKSNILKWCHSSSSSHQVTWSIQKSAKRDAIPLPKAACRSQNDVETGLKTETDLQTDSIPQPHIFVCCSSKWYFIWAPAPQLNLPQTHVTPQLGLSKMHAEEKRETEVTVFSKVPGLLPLPRKLFWMFSPPLASLSEHFPL